MEGKTYIVTVTWKTGTGEHQGTWDDCCAWLRDIEQPVSAGIGVIA